MNDGIKQRVVGALVLVALAVIFLPVVFDKERIVPVDRKTQIPDEPNIEVLPLPEPPTPPRPKTVRSPESVDGLFSVEETDNEQTRVEQSDKQTITETEKKSDVTHQKSWVLQVASFKSHERADALLSTLEKEQGLRGFVRSFDIEQGERVRVYIGPSLNKSDMEKAKRLIDQQYQLESMVLAFNY